MSRILFLSVVLTVLPVAASAQQAQVLAPDESSAPAAPSAVPLSKPLASEPEHRSLALTTLGAVAGAGFGLAMASAFSEDLCVAGETGCSALLLSVYGGFITLGASAAAEAAGSEPAWWETGLGALAGGALTLILSEMYEGRFSDRDPSPEESVVIGISLLVPPIVGAVIGNRLGQGDSKASRK